MSDRGGACRSWHADASEGASYYRVIDDASAVAVYPMTYGKERVCLLVANVIERGFCYASPARAREAAEVWSGEGDPLDGWHRDPFTGRRREGGDPAKEVVRW